MKRMAVTILWAIVVSFCFSLNLAQATPITASSDPALDGATVIDFQSQGPTQYTTLSIGPVTFAVSDAHLRISSSYSGDYGTSGRSLDNGTYDDPGFLGLTISFDSPTSAFGFQWGAAEGAAVWNLRAYNSLNVLLDTYLLPNTQSSSTGAFVGIAANNISYATLINSSGSLPPNGTPYDWIFVDNFAYQIAPIPEPTSLLLLGTGLGILLLGTNRRRKR